MKYLFLSPHVDDSDLMCGGTIAKLIEQGQTAHVTTMSHIYEEVDLIDEWKGSMNVLGVKPLDWCSFKTRLFYTQQNEILQYLFHLKKRQYDYIFIPSVDFHSDHSVTSKQAQRAFKDQNLLSYKPEWNSRTLTRNYFVKLEHRHVQKKLEALACYKSQQHRPYFKQDVIVGAMHVNGMMVNCEFAEAFEVVNLIV